MKIRPCSYPLLCLLAVPVFVSSNNANAFLLKENPLHHQNSTLATDDWILPSTCNGKPTYNITVIFVNEDGRMKDRPKFPEKLKAPVLEAAEMWSRAIVRKKLNQSMSRMNVSLLEYETYCGVRKNTLIEIDTDSLLLCASYMKLDEDNGAIAQGGHLIAETIQWLPTISFIQFDSDNDYTWSDFDHSDWTNLAFHEIAHALGFGPTYAYEKMRIGANLNFLNGSSVMREWEALNSPLPYPVTSDNNYHWSMHCFHNEVMLPELEKGKIHRKEDGRQHFSRLSLAVFEDIGYEVNYNCTDKVALLETCTAAFHPPFKQFTPRKVAKWASVLTVIGTVLSLDKIHEFLVTRRRGK